MPEPVLIKKRDKSLLEFIAGISLEWKGAHNDPVFSDVHTRLHHLQETCAELGELYHDTHLYSSPDQFSPPSERGLNVLRFELTFGCDWSRCTYCDGYGSIPFVEKSIDEYRGHLEQVFSRLSDKAKSHSTRAFIGGGNALAVNAPKLEEALILTTDSFLFNTNSLPIRISIYGRTDAIIRKGKEKSLKRLNASGLKVIYWGMESGSTSILHYAKKGYSKESILEAAEYLAEAGIEASVMIMPGLGGVKYYREQVEETAEVLNHIKPAYITFLGVNPAPHSDYTRRMNKEIEDRANRPLTDPELTTQMIDIIERIDFKEMKLGCFGPEVDGVGHNPINFGSVRIKEEGDRRFLVYALRSELELEINQGGRLRV